MELGAPRRAVLIDSNLFIAAEDHADEHAYGRLAAELIRLVPELGFQLLLSHGTRSDALDAPPERRKRRLRQLEKYTVLQRAPEVEATRAVFPSVLTRNNAADLEVLNAFATGRAQWLVTQDAKLRSRAKRAGLGGVLSLAEAVEYFRSLKDPVTQHVPAVEEVEGYQVRLEARIFDSLREDYDDFADWWKQKVSSRPVVILGSLEDPEGVAVLKPEQDAYPQLPGPVLKICTFKVAETVQGDKRGELLLRASVDHARQRDLPACYLEVLPDKEELLGWLADFGFAVLDATATERGELVVAKRLAPDTAGDLAPLEHAIAHGPGSVRLERAHVVPIADVWLNILFPDAVGGDLFAGTRGCGNAIRKAYLCRASTNKVEPGDALTFMHTGVGRSRLRALGVVEATFRSDNPDEILAFVGTRTVYSKSQVEQMCAKGAVLALLFRHDRVLDGSILTRELIAEGVLNGTPQSITELSAKGVAWLSRRLGV